MDKMVTIPLWEYEDMKKAVDSIKDNLCVVETWTWPYDGYDNPVNKVSVIPNDEANTILVNEIKHLRKLRDEDKERNRVFLANLPRRRFWQSWF